MRTAAKVISDPIERSERLYQLDVPEDALKYALEYGYRQAAQSTENDPLTTKGYIAWAKTTRGLRDKLSEKRWKRSNLRGYARTVHPDGKLAIVVASGNAQTGEPHSDWDPITRSAHGPATRDAIEANEQLDFSAIDPSFPRPVVERIALLPTWMLLHRYDPFHLVIKAELSQPNEMNDQGHVVGWGERIVLNDIPFDGTSGISVTPLGGSGDTGPIDVPVVERSASS